MFKQDLGVISKEEAETIENKKTRELIKVHGTNNVRGGDIKMMDNLIRRFGYFHKLEDWEALTLAMFLFLWGFFWMILYLNK